MHLVVGVIQFHCKLTTTAQLLIRGLGISNTSNEAVLEAPCTLEVERKLLDLEVDIETEVATDSETGYLFEFELPHM